jgi:uncharacterized protein YecT (DUF1311 family)
MLAAVIVFLVSQACHAPAMEFVIETGDNGVKVVRAFGPIRPGDAEKLRAVAGQATIGPGGLRAMLLSGPGGLVEEAKLVARLISAFDFKTMVDDDCASACASILYPAGKAFILLDKGRLGFHPCYSAVDLKELPECTEDIAQFSLRNGFPYGSIKVFASVTSATDIFWVSNVLARCYGMERFSGEKPPASYTQICPAAYFEIIQSGYFKNQKLLKDSFDCDAGKTPMEILLCADVEVRHLDALMGALYQTMMKRSGPDQKLKLRQSQREWITARGQACPVTSVTAGNRTASRCVSERTMERLSELLTLSGHPLVEFDLERIAR